MTREEAIKILKYNSNVIHKTINGETDSNEVEALDMAISALEHPERNVVAIVPCGDAISRQEAIDTIRQLYLDLASQKAVIDILKVLPSVTPIRPKGHWEHGRELSRVFIGDALRGINYEDWHCSNCHCVIEQSIKPKWNYCPNCGADMREVEV